MNSLKSAIDMAGVAARDLGALAESLERLEIDPAKRVAFDSAHYLCWRVQRSAAFAGAGHHAGRTDRWLTLSLRLKEMSGKFGTEPYG